MLNIERMEYILEELKSRKTVYVAQLSKKYYVSPSTIRRDLSILEEEGIIRRTYGGAVLIEQQSTEIPYLLRQNENQQGKDILGLLASELVKDDMYIFLDHTSTIASMTKFLGEKKNLKILTTSAQIAINCLDTLPAQVYCTGGWISPISRGFTGESARSRIAGFYPDYLFFSVRSVSLEQGATDVNEEDVYLKQEMLKSCKKSVLLCDIGKLGKLSYRKVCNLSELDYIVINQKPNDEWLEALSNLDVKLIYPHKE
ncbi:DeoR/GlpR family DNA-binding transcription regulator [Cellulosilyticum sp. I15G10I2]|uniref:DeoR/GlpR family DNA-binding transcription regulator n=1 Tax=Cellulosilyticum sp. I15G10I2 TaxID=1892843 RepID=UPI00085C1E6B|nr:DeoR/GlpR family DNA-binding transcription regulator [Cellulosilyticum sp. I15G10I2]